MSEFTALEPYRRFAFGRMTRVTAVLGVLVIAAFGGASLFHAGVTGGTPTGAGPGGQTLSGTAVPASLASAVSVHNSVGSIGSVVSTLDLATNTLYSGAASFGIQQSAQIPVYDSLNGMIYVRGSFGTDISVVNATTFTDVANIVVPSITSVPFPTNTIALDNKTNYLYTTNGGNLNVSIINTKTNHVTGSLPVGGAPQGIAFDWVHGNFYTANEATNNVTIFSASLNKTIHTVNVGQKPTAIVYDHQSGDVFVANWNSANVSVINTATYTHADVSVGKFPTAFAIDTTDDFVDVLNSTGNWGGVTVIDPAGPSVHDTVRAGFSPESLAYDGASDRLFVSNGGSNNLTIVQQPAGTIVPTGLMIGHGAVDYSAAYDSVNHDVYVGCFDGGGSASGNITVVDGTTARSVANITTSNFPVGVTIGPSGDVFVVNQGPASQAPEPNITVLSVTNNLPIASIPLFVSPSAETYDSGENSLYVVDNSGNDLYRVNPSTGLTSGVEYGGPVPVPSTYVLPLVSDSRNGDIYVVDNSRTAIDVFTSAHVFLKSIPVGPNPTGIAYDSENGTLFVSQDVYGNVSIIDGSTNSVLATTLKLGSFANLAAIAYDPHNNTIYVANLAANNVTAFNATTYSKLKTIPVGLEPTSFAVDSQNHTVFVANLLSGNLTVINDTTNQVVKNPTISSPHLLVYDNGTNSVYNADYASNEVSAIDASSYATLTGSPLHLGGIAGFYTEGITYDWTNGDVYVTNSDGDSLQAISAAPSYAVTFQEMGLIPGTSWSVTLQGVQHTSIGTTIGFTEPVGTWSFTVAAVAGYTQNVTSGNVVVTSGPVTKYIGFTSIASSYPVTFIESGLPGSSLWNVTLNGVQNHSTTNSIGFLEPTGTWAFVVGTYTGYVANNTSGNVHVSTTAITVYIGFTALSLTFPVTFIESGLSPSTPWNVSFYGGTNHSATSSIGFRAPNGDWPFTVAPVTGYSANVTGGTVTVAGAAKNVYIGFTSPVPTYPVNFTETGLPNLTPWTVTLNGTHGGSSTSTITFYEPTGSYPFTVGAVSGYSANPNSGSAIVSGAPYQRAILFTAGTSPLTAQLTANPAALTLGGASALTTTTTGGTPPFAYVYTGLPTGCTTHNSSSWSCTPTVTGSFTINVTVTDAHGNTTRASTTLTVSAAGTSSPSGIGSLWIVLLVVLVVVAVVIFFVVWRRRHQPPPPSTTPTPPPPDTPPPP